MRFFKRLKSAAALMLAAAVIFLPACSKEEKASGAQSDGGEAKATGYVGGVESASEALSAVEAKIAAMIEQNNAEVEQRAGEKYFLEPDYLLTAFTPFKSDYLGYTLSFKDGADEDEVVSACAKLVENGGSLGYKHKRNLHVLTVAGEADEYELRGECSGAGESVLFTRTVFYPSGEVTEEFFEAVNNKNIGCYIQGGGIRCFVSFDANGEPDSFYCSMLLTGAYDAGKDALFGGDEMPRDAYTWVTQRGKDACSAVFSFNGGVLKCEENSAGEWKTVEINSAATKQNLEG